MTASTAPVPLDPDAVAERNGGPLGLVALQVVTEVRSVLRSPEFVIGLVGIPGLLFAMFGLANAGQILPEGTDVGALLLVSFAAYGTVSLAIFAFGDEVAKERGRGWTRTLEATPLPTWVHLAGKLVMAAAYTLLILALVGTIAVVGGGISLPLLTWVRLAATLIGGVLAFSTFGFAIAYLVRPRAATAIANLIFLPLSFCSGFFFPLSDLPAFLRDAAPYLPTYHLGQLAWQQVGSDVDVAAMVGVAPQPPLVHLAWVLGSTVVFGLVAVWAANREGVTRRG